MREEGGPVRAVRNPSKVTTRSCPQGRTPGGRGRDRVPWIVSIRTHAEPEPSEEATARRQTLKGIQSTPTGTQRRTTPRTDTPPEGDHNTHKQKASPTRDQSTKCIHENKSPSTQGKGNPEGASDDMREPQEGEHNGSEEPEQKARTTGEVERRWGEVEGEGSAR